MVQKENGPANTLINALCGYLKMDVVFNILRIGQSQKVNTNISFTLIYMVAEEPQYRAIAKKRSSVCPKKI